MSIMSNVYDPSKESIDEFFSRSAQTSSELIHSKPTPIPYLIDPLIIAGNYHILTGPIGNMKSYFSLWVAGKLSETHKVLFVDKENGLLMIEARARNLGLPDTDNLIYWCERPGMKKEEVPPDFKTGFSFYEYIARTWNKPCLIFDTLNRFGPGLDENSVKDMTFITDKLIRLRNLGCTVIALHQVGKPSIESGYQTYRGSSEIGGGMDIGLTIKNFKQINDHSASFTIHCFKTRWLPFADQRIVFDSGDFYVLPHFIKNSSVFFALRQGITNYLKQCPEVRGNEIMEVMSSKKWGGFSKNSTQWILSQCRHNYWMKLEGGGNSFTYKNIPSVGV